MDDQANIGRFEARLGDDPANPVRKPWAGSRGVDETLAICLAGLVVSVASVNVAADVDAESELPLMPSIDRSSDGCRRDRAPAVAVASASTTVPGRWPRRTARALLDGHLAVEHVGAHQLGVALAPDRSRRHRTSDS